MVIERLLLLANNIPFEKKLLIKRFLALWNVTFYMTFASIRTENTNFVALFAQYAHITSVTK